MTEQKLHETCDVNAEYEENVNIQIEYIGEEELDEEYIEEYELDSSVTEELGDPKKFASLISCIKEKLDESCVETLSKCPEISVNDCMYEEIIEECIIPEDSKVQNIILNNSLYKGGTAETENSEIRADDCIDTENSKVFDNHVSVSLPYEEFYRGINKDFALAVKNNGSITGGCVWSSTRFNKIEDEKSSGDYEQECSFETCGINSLDDYEGIIETEVEEAHDVENNVMFKCTKCSMAFFNRNGYIKHSKSPCDVVKRSIQCINKHCDLRFARHGYMIRHIQLHHSINDILEKVTFNSEKEFRCWRQYQEIVNDEYMVKMCGNKETIRNTRMYYVCQFDTFRRHVKSTKTSRRRKSGYMPHIPCPARMWVHIHNNGKIVVTYIKKHSHPVSDKYKQWRRLPDTVVKFIEKLASCDASPKLIQELLYDGEAMRLGGLERPYFIGRQRITELLRRRGFKLKSRNSKLQTNLNQKS